MLAYLPASAPPSSTHYHPPSLPLPQGPLCAELLGNSTSEAAVVELE